MSVFLGSCAGDECIILYHKKQAFGGVKEWEMANKEKFTYAQSHFLDDQVRFEAADANCLLDFSSSL